MISIASRSRPISRPMSAGICNCPGTSESSIEKSKKKVSPGVPCIPLERAGRTGIAFRALIHFNGEAMPSPDPEGISRRSRSHRRRTGRPATPKAVSVQGDWTPGKASRRGILRRFGPKNDAEVGETGRNRKRFRRRVPVSLVS